MLGWVGKPSTVVVPGMSEEKTTLIIAGRGKTAKPQKGGGEEYSRTLLSEN